MVLVDPTSTLALNRNSSIIGGTDVVAEVAALTQFDGTFMVGNDLVWLLEPYTPIWYVSRH